MPVCSHCDSVQDPIVHAAVERALIFENGVTSVTLDKSRGQATVFGSSTIDIMDLVAAVRSKGFTCDTWENKRKANPLASSPPGYLDEVSGFSKKGVNQLQ